MKFKTPDIYTNHYQSWEFEEFDSLYERENMPQLIANGWPVNWNYVSKENACWVCAALIQRTLNVKTYALQRYTKDIIASVRDKASQLMTSNKASWEEISEISTHEA